LGDVEERNFFKEAVRGESILSFESFDHGVKNLLVILVVDAEASREIGRAHETGGCYLALA